MVTDRKVIVIGSGPSGAMAAYELVRNDIPVTMIESGDRAPEGMLIRVMGRNIYRRGTNRGFESGPGHIASGDPKTEWTGAIPLGLFDQEALNTALERAQERGVAVIACGCFGAGLLKASLTQEQLQEMTSKWQQIMEYRRIAAEHHRDLMEMALQFSLGIPRISVTLLGMRTEEHLTSNLRYLAARPLSDTQYHQLTQGHFVIRP